MFQCALSATLLSPGIAVYMNPGPNAGFCAADEVMDVDGTAMFEFMVSFLSLAVAKMLLMF